MPVEFLTDAKAGAYGRFPATVSDAQLAEYFHAAGTWNNPPTRSPVGGGKPDGGMATGTGHLEPPSDGRVTLPPSSTENPNLQTGLILGGKASVTQPGIFVPTEVREDLMEADQKRVSCKS